MIKRNKIIMLAVLVFGMAFIILSREEPALDSQENIIQYRYDLCQDKAFIPVIGVRIATVCLTDSTVWDKGRHIWKPAGRIELQRIIEYQQYREQYER